LSKSKKNISVVKKNAIFLFFESERKKLRKFSFFFCYEETAYYPCFIYFVCYAAYKSSGERYPVCAQCPMICYITPKGRDVFIDLFLNNNKTGTISLSNFIRVSKLFKQILASQHII